MSITCAYHDDRTALAYCAGCGKPLCGQCVVRLSTGNYCDTCAAAPDHRPQSIAQRSRAKWWIIGAVILTVVYVVSRLIF
jgi:hypothetical protein